MRRSRGAYRGESAAHSGPARSLSPGRQRAQSADASSEVLVATSHKKVVHAAAEISQFNVAGACSRAGFLRLRTYLVGKLQKNVTDSQAKPPAPPNLDR